MRGRALIVGWLLCWAVPSQAASFRNILAKQIAAEESIEARARQSLALRSLLKQDFAYTPSLETIIAQVVEDDPLEQMRRPVWMDDMEKQQSVAVLRQKKSKTQLRAAKFDIPLRDHPLVDSYIDYFTGRGRWFFEKWLRRMGRYRGIISKTLSDKKLPQDLIYLAMIESGMQTSAKSSASAVGLWQFIRSTGRLYKLRVDDWIDERQDFEEASFAAAWFLRDLKREFGDWHLAWAAYNGGSGRVRRALKRTRSTTFWELLAKKALPQETRHYVPKIIAAAIVAKHPKLYGFDHVKPMTPLRFDRVIAKRGADLRVLAKKLRVSLSSFARTQPAIQILPRPPRNTPHSRAPPHQSQGAGLLGFRQANRDPRNVDLCRPAWGYFGPHRPAFSGPPCRP